MKRLDFKTFVPYIAALLVFVSVSAIYFYPVLQGYKVKQTDIKEHKGMSQEIRSHKEKFKEEPLWTGNMFSGMPAYQISKVKYNGDILGLMHKILQLGFAHPIGLLILYMIGFYILLLSLRINPWISIIGAIAFAFSSYFIVIIEAGHTSKAYAIAYMGPILGGVISILRGRIWIGILLTSLFMGLELFVNHLQITYYLIIPLLVVGIVEMISQLKKGNTATFFKRAGLVVVAVFLGILPNLGHLLTTYEYSKVSTRSPSELTIKPDGSSNDDIKSTGLDKDYITRWSYGIEETITLLLPNAKGGKSGAILADEEEMKRLRRENPQFFNFMVNQYQNERFIVDTYWGNQPFTSGPVYAGSVVCFLAILALIFVKDRLVIGLSIAALFAILLSWGRNFMGLTEFFIDYIPLYNKFRAVSMILVVVELVLPLLAILFLSKLYKEPSKIAMKKLFIVMGTFIGILLLFWLTPDTFFDFLSNDDQAHLKEQLAKYPNKNQQLFNAFDEIENLRIDVFKADVLNALKYLILTALLIVLFLYKKINSKILFVGIGALVVIDLWSLDKKYLNNEEKVGASRNSSDRYKSYVLPTQMQSPYSASPVDKSILNKEFQENPTVAERAQEQIQKLKKENPRLDRLAIETVQFTELMRGTHFRVMNTTKKMDEDAQTAYFFKTLGGYHGAKMKKYQELIDFELGREYFQLRQTFLKGGQQAVNQVLPSMNVTNMLNAKYIIGAVQTKEGQQLSYIENRYALGNAWFVEDYRLVENANAEILALKNLKPSQKAVIRRENEQYLSANYNISPQDRISLVSYLPNELVYEYKTQANRLAVFSEIYYEKGWSAYINGEKVPHFKVNYILRGMEVPSGQGQIVFKFEPASYEVGKVFVWISTLVFLALIGFVVYREVIKTDRS